MGYPRPCPLQKKYSYKGVNLLQPGDLGWSKVSDYVPVNSRPDRLGCPAVPCSLLPRVGAPVEIVIFVPEVGTLAW